VNKSRRYVRIVTPGLESTGVQLAEFEVFGPVTTLPAPIAGQNVALRQPASQSLWGEYFGDAMRATDGNGDGNYFNYSTSFAGSAADANGAWWQTDLGRTVNTSTIRIWNRTDCCREFLFPGKVFVSATPFTSNDPAVLAATPGVSTFDLRTDPGTPNIDIPVNVPVRYVRVQLPGAGRILMLAEVEVLAA
jgi:hypothetical protein